MKEEYRFWFIFGSQHLYGPEVLKKVAKHGIEMVARFNGSNVIPFEVVSKGVVTTGLSIE